MVRGAHADGQRADLCRRAARNPKSKSIYYHAGLDIGGAEGMVEIVAATDGLVVSRGNELLPEHDPKTTPVRPRYDVVYLLDDRGWYYRYSHMQTIDPAMQAGRGREEGATAGPAGEGRGDAAAGRTSISRSRAGSPRASGARRRATRSSGRPRSASLSPTSSPWPGPTSSPGWATAWSSTAAKSWCRDGRARHGSIGRSPTARPRPGRGSSNRTIDPGTYSEILRVTDSRGRFAYDFADVQIVDPATARRPSAHDPCRICPHDRPARGRSVTFKVRTFRTTDGSETWDFGDGSPGGHGPLRRQR